MLYVCLERVVYGMGRWGAGLMDEGIISRDKFILMRLELWRENGWRERRVMRGNDAECSGCFMARFVIMC